MKNNNKGFTLIEILAAITILAIISTIATVAVFRYLDRTRKSSYETMEKSICDAANNYVINEGLESDVVEAGEDGVTYDAKELMSSKYLENLMDPKNNKKVCSANVNVRVTDATLDDDAIPEYYYFVKLRCKDYSSDVGFSSGCALNKNVSDPGTDEPVVEPDDDGTGGNTPDTSDKTLYGVVAKSSNGTDVHISYLPTFSTGVYTMRETLNDNFPIHYYRGNVDNNNVVFQNFCWKIVRTTSTGGVKLLYNGVVNADGGCNNTGTASQIGTSYFNKFIDGGYSPADTGYMYGERYTIKNYHKFMDIYDGVYSNGYLHSKSVTYSNGVYILVNAETRTNSDDNTGYYTCLSKNGSCPSVYYIVHNGYAITLKNGETNPDSQVFYLGKDFKDNGDGTYTLTDSIVVKKKDWYTDYAKYSDYYFCEGLASTTCSDIRYLYSSSYNTMYYDDSFKFVYGSDVSWDGSKYTLIDTFVSTKLVQGDKDVLSKKYRYTCLNTIGVCDKVYYVDGVQMPIYYYILENGDDILDAMDKMFASTNSSIVKNKVDSWFRTNMLSQSLEDTVWCADREYGYVGGNFFGSESDYFKNSLYYPYRYDISASRSSVVSCPNTLRDAYTVSESSGGNGFLDYPVGLLTVGESLLAGGSMSYLDSGETWWTMSPISYHGGAAGALDVIKHGIVATKFAASSDSLLGIRPVVSLKQGIEVKSGDGTVSSPYELEL